MAQVTEGSGEGTRGLRRGSLSLWEAVGISIAM